MANLIPVVEPPVSSVGIPITIQPVVLFGEAIDVGSISASNFVFVCLQTSGGQNNEQLLQTSNSVNNIVDAEISYRKVELSTLDTSIVKDYGDLANAGKLFRSEITIKPKAPLNPNSNYAVIISKNVSLLSVFDAVSDTLNTGTGALKTAGVHTGLTETSYTILITAAGQKNSAMYTWRRHSDNYVSVPVQARARHIEIDNGIKIKFEEGDYSIGDSWQIKVKPQDKMIDIFGWNFATGLGSYQVPADDKSGNVVNLPVITGAEVPPAGDFYVVSVEPVLGSSLIRLAAKGAASLQGIILQTKLETADYNGWKLEYVSGAVAGSETVSVTGNVITVQIAAGVTSAITVANLLNNKPQVSANFEALTASTGSISSGKVRVAKGVDPNKIIVTFSKDIDPLSIANKVVVTSSDVYPMTMEEELYFEASVVGNKLILSIED